MSVARYNVFNQIHKGLRALLFDTALKLQQTDFNDEAATSAIFDQIQRVLWLFHGHADTEDNMVLPLIEKKAPVVAADFEKEHETDHLLAVAIQKAMQRYEQLSSQEERTDAGTAVLIALNEFVAFNLSHMNREETLLNPILWQHYTDEQLVSLTQEIVIKTPQHKNELYSRWMLKGLGMQEIVGWYRNIQATAPHFVFEQFCFMAEEELAIDHWNILKTELGIENLSDVTA
jgi:hemerythrin-like domain-containing protein